MTATIPALLAPIRATLAAATPGPWRTEPVDDGRFAGVESRVYSLWGSHILLSPTDGESGQAKNADAVFIASAPVTVTRLLAAVDAVEDLARVWTAKGEHDMAYSKIIPDEDIAMELLTHGADMVEKARHIRNALIAALETKP